MIRVAVLGARGRMGGETCRAVEAAPDLELVAALGRDDDLGVLRDVDVAVDFTTPTAVLGNIAACLDAGTPVVVGTTGMTAERLADVERRLATAPELAVAVVPNFSIGAVLVMRFAAQAAPHFDSVEIVELHHPNKKDAPSGTAARTAALVADARRAAGIGGSPDATETALAGARGADVEGVHVHAVRLAGYTASQEVLLGGHGEVVTLRHDSFDRVSFMPGVLRVVRQIRERRGLVVGLEPFLDE